MQININGSSFNVPDGSSVSVVNGVLTVNGSPSGVEFTNELRIEVIGGLASLRADRGSVTVNGSVHGNVDAGGSATISGDVTGKVNSGGSLTCGNIGGNANAGGSMRCGTVSGNINAGGSVRHG